MSTEPLVSVIIPAYRAEATLPAAVRSLLAQTCPSWQAIIASDDGVDYLAVLARAGIHDERLQQVSTGACGVARATPATRRWSPRPAQSCAIWMRTTSFGPIAWGSWRRLRSLTARPSTTPGCTDGAAISTSGRSPPRTGSGRSRRRGLCARAFLFSRCSGASWRATAGPRSRSRPTCCSISSCCAPPVRWCSIPRPCIALQA